MAQSVDRRMITESALDLRMEALLINSGSKAATQIDSMVSEAIDFGMAAYIQAKS
jgi:hypothetical protein